jgi:hypothetical protein
MYKIYFPKAKLSLDTFYSIMRFRFRRMFFNVRDRWIQVLFFVMFLVLQIHVFLITPWVKLLNEEKVKFINGDRMRRNHLSTLGRNNTLSHESSRSHLTILNIIQVSLMQKSHFRKRGLFLSLPELFENHTFCHMNFFVTSWISHVCKSVPSSPKLPSNKWQMHHYTLPLDTYHFHIFWSWIS